MCSAHIHAPGWEHTASPPADGVKEGTLGPLLTTGSSAVNLPGTVGYLTSQKPEAEVQMNEICPVLKQHTAQISLVIFFLSTKLTTQVVTTEVNQLILIPWIRTEIWMYESGNPLTHFLSTGQGWGCPEAPHTSVDCFLSKRTGTFGNSPAPRAAF